MNYLGTVLSDTYTFSGAADEKYLPAGSTSYQAASIMGILLQPKEYGVSSPALDQSFQLKDKKTDDVLFSCRILPTPTSGRNRRTYNVQRIIFPGNGIRAENGFKFLPLSSGSDVTIERLTIFYQV